MAEEYNNYNEPEENGNTPIEEETGTSFSEEQEIHREFNENTKTVDVDVDVDVTVTEEKGYKEVQDLYNKEKAIIDSAQKSQSGVSVDPRYDPDKAKRIKTLEAKIEAIEDEVRRNGCYIDKENNVTYSKAEARKIIQDLENKKNKEEGLLWCDQDSRNPLVALLKLIVRSLMYMVSSEYRKAKNQALDREDDLIRKRMDIELSGERRKAEHEIEEYLGVHNEKNTEMGKDEEPINLDDPEEQLLIGQTAPNTGDKDTEDMAKASAAIEDLIDEIGENSKKVDSRDAEQGERKGPESDPEKAAKIRKQKQEAKKVNDSRKLRHLYVLNVYGQDYDEMNVLEQIRASADFIINGTHEKNMPDGSVKSYSNKNLAKYLAPEFEGRTIDDSGRDMPNLDRFSAELLSAEEKYMEGRAQPEHIKKYAEKNVLENAPFAANYILNQLPQHRVEMDGITVYQPDTNELCAKIAEMAVINTETLRYIPENYISENIQEIAKQYKETIVTRHENDLERQRKNESVGKNWKAPDPSEYVKQLFEHADKVNDETYISGADVLLKEVYKELVEERINGYDLDFSEATAGEGEITKTVTQYESIYKFNSQIIESDEYGNDVVTKEPEYINVEIGAGHIVGELIENDETRDEFTEKCENTITRIDKELALTSPDNEERIRELGVRKEELKNYIDLCKEREYEGLEQSNEGVDTPENANEFQENNSENGIFADEPIDNNVENVNAEPVEIVDYDGAEETNVLLSEFEELEKYARQGGSDIHSENKEFTPSANTIGETR